MSAREMFEELGYEYVKGSDYTGVVDGNYEDVCYFDLKKKTIDVHVEGYTVFGLFKAIQQQIEELGWQ